MRRTSSFPARNGDMALLLLCKKKQEEANVNRMHCRRWHPRFPRVDGATIWEHLECRGMTEEFNISAAFGSCEIRSGCSCS